MLLAYIRHHTYLGPPHSHCLSIHADVFTSDTKVESRHIIQHSTAHTFIHLILTVLWSCLYLAILNLDLHPCFVERATKHNDRPNWSIQFPMRTVDVFKSAGTLSILLHLDHFVRCKEINREWSAQVHGRQHCACCLCCLHLWVGVTAKHPLLILSTRICTYRKVRHFIIQRMCCICRQHLSPWSLCSAWMLCIREVGALWIRSIWILLNRNIRNSSSALQNLMRISLHTQCSIMLQASTISSESQAPQGNREKN